MIPYRKNAYISNVMYMLFMLNVLVQCASMSNIFNFNRGIFETTFRVPFKIKTNLNRICVLQIPFTSPRPGGKLISKMMDNPPGSPTLSTVSTYSSKHSGKGDSESKKGKKSTGKKPKGSTVKRPRTKPCPSKTSLTVDPTSTSNLGQVGPEVYVVEKIVRKKVVDDVPYYFIKWKGWGPVHNTWEPVENLDGCPDLLEKYEKLESERKENRNRKKGKSKRCPSEGGDDDEDDSLIFEPTDEMKKTREEVVVSYY